MGSRPQQGKEPVTLGALTGHRASEVPRGPSLGTLGMMQERASWSRWVGRACQAEKEGLGIRKWEHQARWGAVLWAFGPQ